MVVAMKVLVNTTAYHGVRSPQTKHSLKAKRVPGRAPQLRSLQESSDPVGDFNQVMTHIPQTQSFRGRELHQAVHIVQPAHPVGRPRGIEAAYDRGFVYQVQ